MRTSSRSDGNAERVALLWDESFLWGIMACKALDAAGLAYEPIRAYDVRSGALAGYQALFVPGGWASNKLKALGDEGRDAIRRFVEQGGAYIGFCGGAGLATRDGIGLVPVTRRPTKDRVPSFSGRIRLNLTSHPLWQGVSEPVFHAWWPSQFVVDGPAKVLATYREALPDAFSSDINVGDAESTGGWKELESVYRINLDPQRLVGAPAVIEGAYGKGIVLLSLLHFDTPSDRNGSDVLGNIWRYFGCAAGPKTDSEPNAAYGGNVRSMTIGDLTEIKQSTDHLIELGKRNFLWYWRNPMLLQWRRGVRGLEYCTLSVMVNETAALMEKRLGPAPSPDVIQHIRKIRELAAPFSARAGELVLRERFAMQKEHITYDRCGDLNITSLRDELFSRTKSYGGLFKELLDEIDLLLYRILSKEHHR